jgi:hypothetical protein
MKGSWMASVLGIRKGYGWHRCWGYERVMDDIGAGDMKGLWMTSVMGIRKGYGWHQCWG